jgi:hypothetical protein
MTRRSKNIGYGIIALWMFWPLIPAFLASLIAVVARCDLDEGDAHACVVLGSDIGGLLYQMFVVGLISIGTFPSGLIALVVFSLFVWWRNRTAAPDQGTENERGANDTARQNWILWLGLASPLLNVLTAIPALIIAATARPLATRAKLGAAIALVTLVATVVSIATSLLSGY